MQRIRGFFRRQSIVPFETVFGFLCMYQGIMTLLGWGATSGLLRQTLGQRWSIMFAISYVLSGCGMFFGIGSNRKDIESIGLITVSTSLVIVAIVLAVSLPFTPMLFNSYVTSAVFISACVIRLIGLLKGKVIIEVMDRLPKT